jgi:hypothetical protein
MTDPIRRRLMLALAAGAGAALLPACATRPGAGVRHYTETISSVLVSQDGKHLVAVGRNHYYAFEMPELLARALQSPEHTELQAEFTPFHVDQNADISGQVTLRMPADASAPALQAAAGMGLQHQPDGSWQATATLAGHRYASWTYKRPDEKQEKLARSYVIEVTSDERLDERAADAAVTPIRTAADGVQLIYYAPLAPIIIPFVFLTRARDH